jgi:hypothetical protein
VTAHRPGGGGAVSLVLDNQVLGCRHFVGRTDDLTRLAEGGADFIHLRTQQGIHRPGPWLSNNPRQRDSASARPSRPVPGLLEWVHRALRSRLVARVFLFCRVKCGAVPMPCLRLLLLHPGGDILHLHHFLFCDQAGTMRKFRHSFVTNRRCTESCMCNIWLGARETAVVVQRDAPINSFASNRG